MSSIPLREKILVPVTRLSFEFRGPIVNVRVLTLGWRYKLLVIMTIFLNGKHLEKDKVKKATLRTTQQQQQQQQQINRKIEKGREHFTENSLCSLTSQNCLDEKQVLLVIIGQLKLQNNRILELNT